MGVGVVDGLVAGLGHDDDREGGRREEVGRAEQVQSRPMPKALIVPRSLEPAASGRAGEREDEPGLGERGDRDVAAAAHAPERAAGVERGESEREPGGGEQPDDDEQVAPRRRAAPSGRERDEKGGREDRAEHEGRSVSGDRPGGAALERGLAPPLGEVAVRLEEPRAAAALEPRLRPPDACRRAAARKPGRRASCSAAGKGRGRLGARSSGPRKQHEHGDDGVGDVELDRAALELAGDVRGPEAQRVGGPEDPVLEEQRDLAPVADRDGECRARVVLDLDLALRRGGCGGRRAGPAWSSWSRCTGRRASGRCRRSTCPRAGPAACERAAMSARPATPRPGAGPTASAAYVAASPSRASGSPPRRGAAAGRGAMRRTARATPVSASRRPGLRPARAPRTPAARAPIAARAGRVVSWARRPLRCAAVRGT